QVPLEIRQQPPQATEEGIDSGTDPLGTQSGTAGIRGFGTCHAALSVASLPAPLLDAQAISYTAHGLEPHRIGGITLDLAPEAIDLDVNGALADLGIRADQLVAR